MSEQTIYLVGVIAYGAFSIAVIVSGIRRDIRQAKRK